MNIYQFLRIFWARKWLIIGTTLACLVGAYLVTLVLPPRWDAHSRVLLGVLKPDPVTGLVIPSTTSRTYISTQVELITDPSVAGQVADELGWITDPYFIQRYQARASNDTRDFRRWLAQLVIDRTKAKVLEDSNIMEITYTGFSAENAKSVADALRKAYIDQSNIFKRDDAIKNATFFDNEAAKAKVQLDAATAAESAYERQNGIIMQDDKVDVDTARLRSLAAQGASAPVMMAPPSASPAASELAQLDVQISQDQKTLGPNHPELIALKEKRAALAAESEKEQASSRAAASAASGNNGSLDRAVQAQKSRVLAQSDKLARLQQLQGEVDLRRDQLGKAIARSADLRQQAALDDTGLTPLGGASTPQKPSFPNMLLIIPGSIAAGFTIGIFISLLIELLSRKVRSADDLQLALDYPLLAVISRPVRNRPSAWGRISDRFSSRRVAPHRP